MVIQIIPSILAPTEVEYDVKLHAVERFSDWVQVDLVDGVWITHKTIDLHVIAKYPTSAHIEVHLMVKDVKSYVERLLPLPVSRIIVPFETTKHAPTIIETIHKQKKEVGLALNPETELSKAKDLIPLCDTLLLMTVHPGYQGQSFLPETLVKVGIARKTYPQKQIAVDGGINLGIAAKIVAAGANILVVGSYIFSGNVKENLQKLRREVGETL